jgi:hypothetical protein
MNGIRGATTLEDFLWRTHQGVRQHIISVKTGLLPEENFVKIGKGSGDCFVTTAKLHKNSTRHMINDISEHLNDVGFDGYLLTLRGGFPNPTGIEAHYTAVPYSFKIFTLVLGRVKYGCRHVIWIDSSLKAQLNPAPLFAFVERHGALIDTLEVSNPQYIYPDTIECLKSFTGVNVVGRHVRAMVLGIDPGNKLVQSAIRELYNLTSYGYPYFSCFPEEFVMSAVFHQRKYESLVVKTPMFRRIICDRGCFFLLRPHPN